MLHSNPSLTNPLRSIPRSSLVNEDSPNYCEHFAEKTFVEEPLRLSQLNFKINESLKNTFQNLNFWVIADITNHSYDNHKNVHYCELVEKVPDSHNVLAKIRCTVFGSAVEKIKTFENLTGQFFTNNINVLVNVSVNFHTVYGLRLSLNDISVNYAIGALEQQRIITLNKLVSDNPSFISFDQHKYSTRNKRLQLPLIIQNIAVISSNNSAGCEDFIHTISNNCFQYNYRVDQYLTNVQGKLNYRKFLLKIIEVFTSGINYDVVVIIRGGGAQTDFLLFDDYNIGRAIAKFPYPVITGIGHHKNETIADIMAHTSLKTPTKVAEFIIANNRSFDERMLQLQNSIIIRTQQILSKNLQNIGSLNNKIVNRTVTKINSNKNEISQMIHRVTNYTRDVMLQKKGNLMKASSSFSSAPKIFLNTISCNFNYLYKGLKSSTSLYIHNKDIQLDHLKALNKASSIESILSRGFALIKKNKQIICDGDQIQIDDSLDIIFLNQRITTKTISNAKHNGTII